MLATPLVPTALQGQLPYVPPKDFFAGLAESCLFKGVTSLVVGGGLGLLAGVVIGGWQSATPPMALPGNPEVPRTTAFRALRETGTLMSTKSISWGKNFAVVGGMFSLVECAIEKTRGQHDLTNSVAGGCVTGAALARNQGPAAMVMGCGGFALFSAAIGMCHELVRGTVRRNLEWRSLTHVRPSPAGPLTPQTHSCRIKSTQMHADMCRRTEDIAEHCSLVQLPCKSGPFALLTCTLQLPKVCIDPYVVPLDSQAVSTRVLGSVAAKPSSSWHALHRGCDDM